MESTLYGWFEYNKHPRTICNYLTHQKLKIHNQEPLLADTELSCEYFDDEISYPITITTLTELKCERLFIHIDYNQTFPNVPSYGHWRRVDDFLTDAVLCWPEFEPKRIFWFTLIVTGGWISGAWQPQLIRQFVGHKTKMDDSFKVNTATGTMSKWEKGKEYPFQIAEPLILPLDQPTPLQWTYSDQESPTTEAPLNFELIGPNKIPYLPSAEPPTGFQNKVPYLFRADRRAFIFPSEVKSQYFYDELEKVVYYTYIDENLFFTFRSDSDYPVLAIDRCSIGFREMPPAKAFWAVSTWGVLGSEKEYNSCSNLSYRTWKQSLTAIVDAWPSWQTTSRQIEWLVRTHIDENIPKVNFWVRVGNYGPNISGGYRGGIRGNGFDLKFLDKLPDTLKPLRHNASDNTNAEIQESTSSFRRISDRLRNFFYHN